MNPQTKEELKKDWFEMFSYPDVDTCDSTFSVRDLKEMRRNLLDAQWDWISEKMEESKHNGYKDGYGASWAHNVQKTIEKALLDIDTIIIDVNLSNTYMGLRVPTESKSWTLVILRKLNRFLKHKYLSTNQNEKYADQGL